VGTDHSTQNLFDRKTDSFFPFQFVFAGYILVLFGVYLLLRYNLLGMLAIAGGLFTSFSRTGIRIDFERKEYREYLGLFRLKMGKWKPLPEIQYVTVFVDKVVQEMHVASISSTQATSDYRINLIVSKTARIAIGLFEDRAKAMMTGASLASQLQCKLLDYTSGKPVWVDPTA
jgi:hypothetical protein